MRNLFRKKSLQTILQEAQNGNNGNGGLHQVLTVRDLTFFGVAAIIGSGIFSAIGNACYSGGPGVVVLYAICAVACGFTALCYAEFAAQVPVSGSAYTYAYVSFGELAAWAIGWALVMEYSVANVFVAFAWSGYFTNLLESLGWQLPPWLSINYTSAHAAGIAKKTGQGLSAWQNAPELAGIKLILDLPAILACIFITWLAYRGTKEARNLSNLLVGMKLLVVALVIVVGVTQIDTDNWTPFMPNGFGGVMGGVSAVFFAYIGFDTVSTLAEESVNPQRDLPRGMVYSLVICTVLYIALALVLTGMVPFNKLGVNDPVAETFKIKGIKWMALIISVAAVIAMTSVLLVFQMGQPRIWMAMSRDGLLPQKFAEIHEIYKTPGFATVATGAVVVSLLIFTDEQFVLDFTSIGTLFAFILVCGGVLTLPSQSGKIANAKVEHKYRLPYINAKYILPILTLTVISGAIFIKPSLADIYLRHFSTAKIGAPLWIFFVVLLALNILAFIKDYSLIPVLGLLSCVYLLTGIAFDKWQLFGLWLLLGLAIYFCYGHQRSKLNQPNGQSNNQTPPLENPPRPCVDSAYSHHGPPVLTSRDIAICAAMARWIEIARERYGDNWLPTTIDMAKSRLFWRLRSGKPPLPNPPPTAYSCPWYELIDDNRPHWAYEMSEWEEKVYFAQCPYQVIERDREGLPTQVGFGDWRFKCWQGADPHGGQFEGWWLQIIVHNQSGSGSNL